MGALAVRSVRHRPGRFLATLLSAFLGAGVVMTFNSLHDTAAGDHVDAVSAETLGLSAGVVGGYGTLLVFFAIASTLTVNVRRRAAELELLRCSGATPAQLRRMVVGEAVAVALAGTVLASGPAMLGGRALLGVFQDSGQVAESVEYAFGPVALVSGVAVTLLAAAGAAFLAVRRVTRRAGRRAGARRALAYGALAAGAASTCSTFAFSATDEALMAPAAYGAILLSVGFALLAARLLTAVTARLPLGGASGWLAVRNLRERAGDLAGILMSLILFTAVSTATLTLQAVESDAVAASGRVKSVDAKNLETLNFTVVGIIAVFVCVLLVNSLYAATAYRSREFGQQRLAGAAPGQVLGTVAVEGALLTVTGVLFGTAAALAGIVPFTVVRTDAVLPDAFWGTWLAMTAVAAAVTLGTSLATARRVLRVPAVGAVAEAA
ncbi:FtsX-like permease family protein [Streptomyces sp. ISL-12]|uniref:FtsX-like permease family protein n=1 Tax=Streptomyces sp. ISL-12 TaxID=2819177 RepID=UPI001BEB37DF|nr:FtsX-like permease family protein [Streptomyces sp. ISL-12]MBT2410412.1 FtsX-like permease family protein [Streptomyces sp. ISL-12]